MWREGDRMRGFMGQNVGKVKGRYRDRNKRRKVRVRRKAYEAKREQDGINERKGKEMEIYRHI